MPTTSAHRKQASASAGAGKPENPFSTHTLPCGLRIICQRRGAAKDGLCTQPQVTYCGLAIDAGTRDELLHESGMAHFTEHMTFKGTGRRTARQIINRMESVGGELNAYTGKEETVYYTTCLRHHLSRAIDLLLDIALHSTYPQEEMSREVEVVIDEIESYNDQPSELIYDNFEELLFASHPLGRNILGDAASLRLTRSEHMQAFARRLYHPGRMVLYVLGDVDPQQVFRLAEKAIGPLPVHAEAPQHVRPQLPVPSLSLWKGDADVEKALNTHQAHVMIGTQSFCASDPRHLHLFLLNNILGGPAMSSRLNLALRERNGLVYTVESNAVAYTDSGLWTVYFGCDPGDISRCIRLVRNELHRLASAPLAQRTLDAARRQLKGQIALSYENAESLSVGMAKRYLHYRTTQTMQQLFARLDSLTPSQLCDTAQQLFAPDRLRTLIYK